MVVVVTTYIVAKTHVICVVCVNVKARREDPRAKDDFGTCIQVLESRRQLHNHLMTCNLLFASQSSMKLPSIHPPALNLAN